MAASSPGPSSGQMLAHHEIVGLIGRGGMGEVHRARDTKLGREVALELLPRELSGEPERAARFDREARTLASLQHPNVASIYGFEEHEGQRFLVMEPVEGEDLSGRLAHGPIAVDEVTAIAAQIAAGLEAAHEKGIVHRDLEPANVMITPDHEVKILDFGLAHARFGDTGDETNIGASPTCWASRAADLRGRSAAVSAVPGGDEGGVGDPGGRRRGSAASAAAEDRWQRFLVGPTRGRRSGGRRAGRERHRTWTGDHGCRRVSPGVDAEGVGVGGRGLSRIGCVWCGGVTVARGEGRICCRLWIVVAEDPVVLCGSDAVGFDQSCRHINRALDLEPPGRRRRVGSTSSSIEARSIPTIRPIRP